MPDGIEEELEIMEERASKQEPKLELAVSINEPIESMTYKEPISVSKDEKLNVVINLFKDNDVSSIFIVEKNELLGIFTERDIVRKIAGENVDISLETIEAYMTKNPETLTVDQPIAYALNKMAAGGFRHVPLLNKEKKLMGCLSFRDIIEHLADFYSNEILNLPPTPEIKQSSREGG